MRPSSLENLVRSSINKVNGFGSQLAEKANQSDVDNLANIKRDKVTPITLAELAQDAKTAMTGGSVAVVGENSTDYINLKGNVRNALNNLIPYHDSKYAQGSMGGSVGGAITESASAYRLRGIGYITIVQGKTCIFENLNENYQIGYYECDKNKNIIKWVNYKTTSTELTFDPNTVYIRLLIKNTVSGSDYVTLPTDIYKTSFRLYYKNEELLNEIFTTIKNPSNKIKVMSYNTGMWYDGVTRTPADKIAEQTIKVRRMFAQNDADIVCMQEFEPFFDVAQTIDAKNNILKKYDNFVCKGSYETSTGTTLYAGLAIGSKLSVSGSALTWLTDSRGYLKGYVNVGGKNVCVINSHCSSQQDPTTYRNAQIQALITTMKTEQYVILFGDFNAYTKDEFQTFVDNGFQVCNAGYLGDFDTWHNFDRATSWSNKVIDNIVVSSNIKIENVYMDTNRTSDHAPLVAELRVI